MPSRRPDFEARLRFLSPEEGGRKMPILAGMGYRPDLHYLDDVTNQLWMIWPMEMTAEDGTAIPQGTPLPPVVTAQMYIINTDLRVSEHRSRLYIGTRFQVMEGPRVSAEGIVTALIGLHND